MEKKNKINVVLFAGIVAVSLALLALIAFLPESCGGLNFPMRVVAITVVFPILLAIGSARVYRACRGQDYNV